MFSKVLSLSLHDPLAPVPLVQEGIKAKGLLPPGIFCGCQSQSHVVRVGAGLVPVWAAPEAWAKGCSRRWDCIMPSPVSPPQADLPQLSLPACVPTVTWAQWPEKGKWESNHPLLPSEGTLALFWQGWSGQVVTCWLLISANSNSCKTFSLLFCFPLLTGEASFYL